jgi:regulator of protease activity HflC (stomatin/prohibitin superfamily)
MRPALIAWVAGAIALLIVAVLFEPFIVVGAGHRGVLLDFGAVEPDSLAPGLHVITPFVQSVVQLDTRIQKSQAVEEAASHDLQDVHATVATNWNIDPEAAPHLYQTIGTIPQILDRVVEPAIANTIKAVTAHFDAEELITKRDQVAEQAVTSLRQYLAPYRINVLAVNVINFSFSPDFSQAIERKQVAQQTALQAQYELDQKRVSAQQQVVEAEAAANAQVARAKGDAQATIVKAEAQAEANAALAKSLDPTILQWHALQAWDGKLPSFVGAGTPLPLLNLGAKP